MNRLLPLAAVLALAACSANSGNQQANIAALESGLTAAETAALSYTSLPRCPQATAVCSDQTKVDQIKSADRIAYNAVKAAQHEQQSGGTPSLEGATAAVAALQALIPALSSTH